MRLFFAIVDVFFQIVRPIFLGVVFASLVIYAIATMSTSRGFGAESVQVIVVCSIGFVLAALVGVMGVVQRRRELREIDRIARETRDDE